MRLINMMKEMDDMIVKGLCKVKQKGLKEIDAKQPNIPAVKRHLNNPEKQMQFSTAHYLNAETGVPIHDIVEIPSTT
jgi:hypothetical protein